MVCEGLLLLFSAFFFFFLLLRLPPSPTLFPYTTLFRSGPHCPCRLPGRSKGPPYRGPPAAPPSRSSERSEEHTSELQSRRDLVCRLLLEKKKYRYAPSYVSPAYHILEVFPFIQEPPSGD